MFDKPTRNHFTIIFERLGAVGVAAVTFAYSVLFNNKSDYSIFQKEYWLDVWQSLSSTDTFFATLIRLSVAAAAVVALTFLIIRWSKTFFYFDGDYLVFEKRTLMKKSSRLPMSAIATVNLERTVFERVVGTARIKLDINSSVTANQTDFVFVLPLQKAKAFENELLRIKKESGEFAAEPQPDAERESVFVFTRKQAVRHVLCSQPLLQIVFSVGVFLSSYIMAGTMNMKVVFPVAIVAVAGWLVNVIFQIMAACDFRVERDERNLYISSGLLNKKNYSFEFSKISALSVKQPLLARMAKLYSAEVAVVGMGNDKKETSQISLLVTKEQLNGLLEKCAGDFRCAGVVERSEKAGLYMSMLGWAALAAAPCAVLWIRYGFLPAVLLAVGALLCALLGWRTKTLCADDSVFSYSQGVLSKKTVWFKYGDIQTAEYKTNFLLSAKKTGRIRISILAGAAMTVHTTGWFKIDDFERLSARFSD